MYVGQTHPTWKIFRSPTFNFSQESFKTYGISNFKSNNAPHFSLQGISATLIHRERYLLHGVKNLPVGENYNLQYVFQKF